MLNSAFMYWWKSQKMSCLKPNYKMPYVVRSNTLICSPVITVTKLLFIVSSEIKMWGCLCLPTRETSSNHAFLSLIEAKALGTLHIQNIVPILCSMLWRGDLFKLRLRYRGRNAFLQTPSWVWNHNSLTQQPWCCLGIYANRVACRKVKIINWIG